MMRKSNRGEVLYLLFKEKLNEEWEINTELEDILTMKFYFNIH